MGEREKKVKLLVSFIFVISFPTSSVVSYSQVSQSVSELKRLSSCHSLSQRKKEKKQKQNCDSNRKKYTYKITKMTERERKNAVWSVWARESERSRCQKI